MLRIMGERAQEEKRAEQERVRNSYLPQQAGENKEGESKEARCACNEDRAACGVCGKGWAQQRSQPGSSAVKPRAESGAKKERKQIEA